MALSEADARARKAALHRRRRSINSFEYAGMSVAQLALENLPAWIFGQNIGEDHVLRDLERCEMFVGMIENLSLIQRGRGLRDDNRDDGLDPAGVRDAITATSDTPPRA